MCGSRDLSLKCTEDPQVQCHLPSRGKQDNHQQWVEGGGCLLLQAGLPALGGLHCLGYIDGENFGRSEVGKPQHGRDVPACKSHKGPLEGQEPGEDHRNLGALQVSQLSLPPHMKTQRKGGSDGGGGCTLVSVWMSLQWKAHRRSFPKVNFSCSN